MWYCPYLSERRQMLRFSGVGKFSAIRISPSLVRYMPVLDTQLACTVKV